MSATMIGITLLVIFFALILCNVPIAVSLGMSTMITMLLSGQSFSLYASMIFAGLAKYTMLAVPFFILAGLIMDKSGISKRIVNLANLLVGPIPGGLAVVSIIVTVFWGAMSGSGPATVVALGSILIPAMVEAGYSAGFAAATIASSAAISVVIPPSINLVVYGVVAGESIGDLFLGGFLPGLLMGAAFIVVALIVSIKRGYRGGHFGTGKEIWAAFKSAFFGLLSPVIILGGIYGGFVTPTEAAVIAVFYSLFVGLFIYKDFKIKEMWKILADACNSSASILIIMSNAAVMTWLITSSGVAGVVSNAMMGISSNRYVVMLLIALILLIAGFFIDGISITYIFVPLLGGVVTSLGYSNLTFGVLMTMAIAVGFTTPPVAVNLYPACNIAKIKLSVISREIIGYVVAGVVAIVICIFFPQIITCLPDLA
jgi:C4-dicarboxylate transporter DctM subunit